MAATASASLERELKSLLGPDAVLPGTTRAYLSDATESRNLRGRADAIALPADANQVAQTVAWCYEHDVPIVPRGGGTGFTGGAVPLDGGVVLSLERLTKVRHLDPGYWRAAVEAGTITSDLRRRARENGLFYPPDPGSAEQSQLGGNIATNAGGPHAFKYGVTGAWISGLEVVLAPGELVTIGGPIRKDVAGYDLKSLLIGSEGTLGIVTAAWVKLIPAPEATLPLAAVYEDTQTGCAAIESALASGVVPAALEYLDAGAVKATRGAFPIELPDAARFMVIADADGSAEEATRVHAELNEVLSEGALAVHAPTEAKEINALWRWRDGAAHAVTAQRGGKVSEDIVVPIDRLSRGDRRDRGHRAPPRPRGMQLGTCRRRQSPLDVHGRPGGAGRARAGRGGGPGSVRARRRAERLDLRRARRRPREGRSARAPVGARRHRNARGDQTGLRSQGPAQPGQEARPGRCKQAENRAGAPPVARRSAPAIY